MTDKGSNKNPVIVLRGAVNNLFLNPIMGYPFIVIIFIQLLLLEIIFFAPRYPLSIFFAPLINYFNGPQYFQYPYNFFLLVNWFQNEWLQYSIYIIFNSFCLGAASAIIYTLNSERNLNMKAIYQQTWRSYVHLVMATIVSAFLIYTLSGSGKFSLYGFLVRRALQIRSVEGPFFMLKNIFLSGAPYLNLILISFVMTLVAFVIPIIIIEKKNVFSALLLNFKILKESFFQVFIIILLPALLYVPLILIKANNFLFQNLFSPEISGVILIISIFITVLIDAIQMVAITIYYLLRKESNEKND